LDGQCVLLAEYDKICLAGQTPGGCDKYFGGVPRCDASGQCGWTYLAASTYCKSFGPGYGLVKVNNQYQNNDYNSLEGEGAWDLAYIGASCKQMSSGTGSSSAAWTWQVDNSVLLDGYTNFDFSVDPTTCGPNQCLVLGGTGYAGKWSSVPCDARMGDAVCAENFNTDAPTPAPNVPLTCDTKAGWVLFPSPDMPPTAGRLGPTKCYQMLSDIKGVTREFTWAEASAACAAEGGGLAKVEDIQTNIFINSALGNSAYGIQWIGGRCAKRPNGDYRFQWAKDKELVASGYTNFPIDYNSGLEQEINPCNAKTVANPTGSKDICMSSGGFGYNYQWTTAPCSNTYGDAICEKIPIGGSDDTPGSGGSSKKKNIGGVVAAGILIPLCLAGAGFMLHKYYMDGRGIGGNANQAFISTSYAPADGTSFSTASMPAAGGAASL